MRRQFWETIVEAVAAVQPPESARGHLRVADVRLDLPMEISTPRTDVGFRVYADVPRQRWREGMIVRPGRVRMHLVATPSPASFQDDPTPAASSTADTDPRDDADRASPFHTSPLQS